MAHKRIIDELEKQGIVGIVPSHGSILHLLYTNNRVTMKELAEFTHKTKPTVTVLVNKLEKMDYLYREKSDQDSRIIFVKLTPKGEELKPIFDDVSKKMNALVYNTLSSNECEAVENILQKVVTNLM